MTWYWKILGTTLWLLLIGPIFAFCAKADYQEHYEQALERCQQQAAGSCASLTGSCTKIQQIIEKAEEVQTNVEAYNEKVEEEIDANDDESNAVLVVYGETEKKKMEETITEMNTMIKEFLEACNTAKTVEPELCAQVDCNLIVNELSQGNKGLKDDAGTSLNEVLDTIIKIISIPGTLSEMLKLFAKCEEFFGTDLLGAPDECSKDMYCDTPPWIWQLGQKKFEYQ